MSEYLNPVGIGGLAAAIISLLSLLVNRREGMEQRVHKQEDQIRSELWKRVEGLEQTVATLHQMLDAARRETVEVLMANGALKVANEQLTQTNYLLQEQVSRLEREVNELRRLLEGDEGDEETAEGSE